MKIVVERRSNHHHAAFANDRSRWGDARTVEEAIGSLVRQHGEAPGIRVEVIGEPIDPNVLIACA